MNILKTAECVSPRHPDKMCDLTSDYILDWYLERDKYARVAIETIGGHARVYIIGEITSTAKAISKTEVENIVKMLLAHLIMLSFILTSRAQK